MAVEDSCRRLVAALSPELEEQMQKLQLSPDTSEGELEAIAKTQLSLQRTYDQTLNKNLSSFLEQLGHSTSQIDRNYALIYRSVWEGKKKEAQDAKEKYNKLITSLFEISRLFIHQEIDEAQLSDSIAHAMSSLSYCEQRATEISSKIPKNQKKYERFWQLHSTLQKALESLKKEIPEWPSKIYNIIRYQHNPVGTFTLHYRELLCKSQQTFNLLCDERWWERSMATFTTTPIEPHTKLLTELRNLLNSQTEPAPDTFKPFLEGIQTFQQEEPKLTPLYVQLQTIVTETLLDKPRAIASIKKLRKKLDEKVEKITKHLLSVCEHAEERACTSVGNKIENQQECHYSACPLKKTKMLARLRKCSRCMKVLYCSEECQKKDWPAHRQVCLLKQQEAQKTTS